MMILGDKKKIRKALRKKDIDIIFSKCPDELFNRGLELGCGDGYQSQFLKRYVKNLTTTDKEKK